MVDRTLDRIPSKPDPVRMSLFNVADLTAGLKPRSYTWNVGLWLDQGREGACVGHGWTHEAVARPVVVNSWPRPNFTATNPQAFAFELYRWAQDHDEWEGHNYDGTSVAAGAKGMALAGCIGEYRWTHDAYDTAVAVSRSGPAVIGVDWYTGMFNPDRFGFLNLTGRVEGGHCILVNGYSLPRKAFRLRNSWGADWGQKGEAWLRFADLVQLLQQGGEVCIPTRRML
jgi:hypothetical protein